MRRAANTVSKTVWTALTVVGMLVSIGCRRAPESAEIAAEKRLRAAEGWMFVEVVGDDVRSKADARTVRQVSAGATLVVLAGSSGIDGHGARAQDWEKRFQAPGVEWLEVKMSTTPADAYSLVFRRPAP